MNTIKKTVLHFITGLQTGGTEKALLDSIINDTKFNHIIFSLKDNKNSKISITFRYNGVKLIEKQNGIFGFFKFIFVAINNLNKEKVVLINGWMYHGAFVAYFLSLFSLKKIKIIFTFRSSLSALWTMKKTTKIIFYLLRFISTKAEIIIFNSFSSMNDHIKKSIKNKNMIVIDNGFTLLNQNLISQYKKDFRTKYSIKKDDLIIGNIGRFHPVKRHITFIIAALETLKLNKSVYFVLGGKNISWKNNFFNKNINQNYKKNFILLDEIEDQLNIISGFDILCHTSVSESFPTVVGEALSLGVDVIATNTGDTKRILANFGQIIDIDDHTQLGNIFNKKIELHTKKNFSTNAKSINWINDNYSMRNYRDNISNLYKSILNGN